MEAWPAEPAAQAAGLGRAPFFSLVAQKVKNLPAMQETWVQFPGEGNGLPLQCSSMENSMDRG